MVPPAPPTPTLHPHACGAEVCFSIEDAKAQALYNHGTREVELALASCNLVERK